MPFLGGIRSSMFSQVVPNYGIHTKVSAMLLLMSSMVFDEANTPTVSAI